MKVYKVEKNRHLSLRESPESSGLTRQSIIRGIEIKKINNMQTRKIVLASKSPRRKELLLKLGLNFEIRESNYKEDMTAKDDPYELAKFLALNKAKDVAKYYDDAIIIAADTFAIFKGKYIGKPKDKAEAFKTLRDFSGQEHDIVSGFAIIDTKNNTVINDCGLAKNKFRNLTDEDINDYIETGEPLHMAGSYGLMDRGAHLAESTSGDFYSIIGLPVSRIYVELRKIGAI